MLHRLLLIAVVGGLFAGLSTTAVQELWAVPLILEAERYETAPQPGGRDAAAHAGEHRHAHDADPAGHGAAAWAPADGAERTLWTAVTNSAFGIGAGLLLGALFLLRGAGNRRTGLAWGTFAYLALSLAPALGLPPELPGSAAAALGERQGWWLLTVACSTVAIVLLVRASGWRSRLVACGIALLPHLLGAPQPEVHDSLVPSLLQTEFIFASLAATLVFWLALGSGVGEMYARLFPAAGTAGPSPTRVEEHAAP